MADDIYVVDPATKEASRTRSITLSAAGFRERTDLQEWVLGHPEILGETLVIISSEFAAFDQSNRRLDLLALDSEANLVVIELKLELGKTFADLQALRYAAFCSTMTMEQVVRAHSRYHGQSEEESEADILEFLGEDEELPEPSDRPRIILVAGSLDDIEITSTALWLRKFDLDIQCIELTPFPVDDKILIVPRLVVPLPEAREYQVRVEKKEATKALKEKDAGPWAPLWSAVREEFDKLNTPLGPPSNPRKSYMKVTTGIGDFHYEWYIRKTFDQFQAAVHFESKDKEWNYRQLERIKAHSDEIAEGIDVPFECEKWGKKWAYAAFFLPVPDNPRDPDVARQAAEAMKHLMERTWPLLSDPE